MSLSTEDQTNGEREDKVEEEEEEEAEENTNEEEEEVEKMDTTADASCMSQKWGGERRGRAGDADFADFSVGCYDWLWTPTVLP